MLLTQSVALFALTVITFIYVFIHFLLYRLCFGGKEKPWTIHECHKETMETWSYPCYSICLAEKILDFHHVITLPWMYFGIDRKIAEFLWTCLYQLAFRISRNPRTDIGHKRSFLIPPPSSFPFFIYLFVYLFFYFF